jgi:hypothetical protein
VRDPQYLRHDTRNAVEIRTTPDLNTDDYVARIFGQKNFMVVEHVNRGRENRRLAREIPEMLIVSPLLPVAGARLITASRCPTPVSPSAPESWSSRENILSHVVCRA